MALKLNHLHLKTPDPEKTAQFYIDTLGATKIADIGEIGVRRPSNRDVSTGAFYVSDTDRHSILFIRHLAAHPVKQGVLGEHYRVVVLDGTSQEAEGVIRGGRRNYLQAGR